MNEFKSPSPQDENAESRRSGQQVVLYPSHLTAEFKQALGITEASSEPIKVAITDLEKNIESATPAQWYFFFQQVNNDLTTMSNSLGTLARGGSLDRHFPKIITSLALAKPWLMFIAAHKEFAPSDKLNAFKADATDLLNKILIYFTETSFSIHIDGDKLEQEKIERAEHRKKIAALLSDEQQKMIIDSLTDFTKQIQRLA